MGIGGESGKNAQALCQKLVTYMKSFVPKPLYPQRLEGPWSQRRRRVAIVLIAVYLLVPYLQLSGHPLLRLKFQDNLVYILGHTFRIADARLLIYFLLSAAFGVFWITALKGRLWCGYGCPQTVFLDWLIRPIEEKIEGSSHRRKILDLQPLSLGLFLRKTSKHLIFWLIAAVIVHGLMLFFIDPLELFSWITSGPGQHWTLFIVIQVMTLALYLDFGFFREQFCSYICPYARFQSLMIGPDTPVITYDRRRGDPRGKRGAELGDCIDCSLCVRVCPAGIDIRQGPQLECIQCGRCADGCDKVMANLKRPLGLIRTVSQRQLEGISGVSNPLSLRVKVFGVVMVLAAGCGIYSLVNRNRLSIQVLRQPGPPFIVMADGNIANYFMFRFSNNADHKVGLRLTSADPDLKILCSACGTELDPGRQSDALVVIEKTSSGARDSDITLSHPESSQDIPLRFLAPGK